MPRVKAVWKNDESKEAMYVGQIVAAVAAETEEAASEAARHVKVQYKQLPHQVVDSDPKFFDEAKNRPSRRDQGNVDEAFTKADVVSQGEYGLSGLTPCCLQPLRQV